MNLVVFLFSFFLWALGAKTAEVVLTSRPAGTRARVESIDKANTLEFRKDTSCCIFEFEPISGFQNEHIDHPFLFIQTSKKKNEVKMTENEYSEFFNEGISTSFIFVVRNFSQPTNRCLVVDLSLTKG